LLLAQNLLGGAEGANEVLVDAFASVGGAATMGEPAPGELRVAVIAHALAVLRTTPRLRVPAAALAPKFLADGHRQAPMSPAAVAHLQGLQGPAGRVLLREEVAALPDDLRVVLVLRDLEGLDEWASAALLGCDGDLVRRQLHLARHGLWALLARSLAKPG
jgi:DNA-directed RNA polymerase specialized sigma24 family protein